MLERILRTAKLSEKDVVAVWPYGSRVYGNVTDASDYDYIIVSNAVTGHQEYTHGNINVHVRSPQGFDNALREHKIYALECINTKSSLVNNQYDHSWFKMDHAVLRKEISGKSSNSWVKAKKKMIIPEEETYIGVKSLFHCLRILKFGKQLAETGNINDFSEANTYWDLILQQHYLGYQWDDFKSYWQPVKNILATEFRSAVNFA